MSDTSQGPGWWIASDGKWYPPEAAAAPAPPPPPAPGPAVPPVPTGPPPPAAPGYAHLPPPPDTGLLGSISGYLGSAVAAAQQMQQEALAQHQQQHGAVPGGPPPPSGWQVTGAEAQVGGSSFGVGAPVPGAAAPGAWTPPPGWVPPPPPAGYVPPAPAYTEIIETPASPFRKIFFTVLGVVALVGMLGGGVFLSVEAFLKQNRQINDMPRGPVPEAFLELEADARETIHLEHDGLSAGDSESPNRRAEELKRQARSAIVTVSGPGPDGPNLPIEGVGGSSVYGFGHEGIAVGRIEVPEDGTYRVTVQGFPSTGEVAIGDVSFGGLAKDFGIGLGLFILGCFVVIPLFRARTPKAVRRARRAA